MIELAPAIMTLEEHFRRTFSELTERIRGEVSRQTAAAAEELIAAMPRIGDTVTESVRLGGYTFTWLVQRIADSGTPPVIR